MCGMGVFTSLRRACITRKILHRQHYNSHCFSEFESFWSRPSIHASMISMTPMISMHPCVPFQGVLTLLPVVASAFLLPLPLFFFHLLTTPKTFLFLTPLLIPCL